MKFLIDAQLPLSLASWLVTAGHQANHGAELDLLAAPDAVIWATALHEGFVVVTKDHDFVEWATVRRPAAPVVWVRSGNISTVALLARLEVDWPQIVARLNEGVPIVEAR